MDREKLRGCISTIIFDFWAKAAAQAWRDGTCVPDTSITCGTPCCVDEYGAEIPGCDCVKWGEYCEVYVYERALVVAKAWTEGAVSTNAASCNETVIDHLAGTVHELNKPVRHCLHGLCACVKVPLA